MSPKTKATPRKSQSKAVGHSKAKRQLKNGVLTPSETAILAQGTLGTDSVEKAQVPPSQNEQHFVQVEQEQPPLEAETSDYSEMAVEDETIAPLEDEQSYQESLSDLDELFMARLKEQAFYSAGSASAPATKKASTASAPSSKKASKAQAAAQGSGAGAGYGDEGLASPDFSEMEPPAEYYGADEDYSAQYEGNPYEDVSASYEEAESEYYPDADGVFEEDYPQEQRSQKQSANSKLELAGKEALEEIAASYREHYGALFSPQGAGAAENGALEQEGDNGDGAAGSGVINLGVTRALGAEQKELLRLQLAQKVYTPEEIYADDYFFSPVHDWEVEASADNKELFLQYSMRWGLRSLLQCAADCPLLISRISVAVLEYLQEHYPLGNDEDQEQFNVLLLVLFAKMAEGDICVNLSSLDSVYATIAYWEEESRRIQLNVGSMDDGDYASRAPELFERFCMMVKRYAPESTAQMHEVLQKSLAVGAKDEINSPLVFDLDRLYLRRYWGYEEGVAHYIHEAAAPKLKPEQEIFLQQAIEVLFPEGASPEVGQVNWQKIAALMATTSNFTVVSGGPGTGKTTTVLRILLLLVCLDPQNRLIALCAPTGKAAARMGESILKQIKDERTSLAIDALSRLSNLSPEEIRSYIPQTAVTVQRLLKVRPNHATPIFNAEHKLLCDVLVVDEVSMLDLALFYRLLQAIEPHCKLLLLGDKDQLSSVEAGAVLAELCARLNMAAEARLQEATLNFLSRMSGYSPQQLLQGKIADHVVLLMFSYRSKDVPEIGQLASLVNNAPRAASSTLYHELPVNIQEGDVYSYLKQKEELEIIARQTDLLDCKSSGYNSDDPCVMQLEQIHELFAKTEERNAQALGLDLKAIHAANAAKAARVYGAAGSKGRKSTKGAKSSKAAAKAAVTEESAQACWPPFRPAISYTRLEGRDMGLMLLDEESRVKQIESFRQHLAEQAVARGVEDNYAPFLERLAQNNFVVSADLKEREELFKLMDRFRMLCSNHHGVLGDKSLNEAICNEVKRTYLQGYGYFGPNDFFPGQIVIITKNDPILGLVNGYVGFCAYESTSTQATTSSTETSPTLSTIVSGGREQAALMGKATATADSAANENDVGGDADVDYDDELDYMDEEQPQEREGRVLRVFIPVGVEERNGKSVTKVNVISTLLLTNYDTGFAMSIHKSQGSEYDKVTMVLSERINRVLTKELVYTGITRAKKCVEVVSSDQALLYAIGHSVDRESGLAVRLQQAPAEPAVQE